jgi:hypothetical protein
MLLKYDWSGFGDNLLAALNNILISFNITGLTTERGVFNWHYLLISMNPMPGDIAGWYEVTDILRLNPVTPESALGQLGALGPLGLILCCIFVSAVLAWLELVVDDRMRGGQDIYVAVILGIVALFALYMLQYPLRSASRMLLYLFILEIARRFFKKIGQPSSVSYPRNNKLIG